MLRFSVIPCLFIVVLPIVVMIFLRMVAAVFRLADRGARYGQRDLPEGHGPAGYRGGRRGRRIRYASRDDRPLPIDAEPVCPNQQCQHTNRPGARYCGRCGTRLIV